eukprot:61163-Rhodomonas_salina.3
MEPVKFDSVEETGTGGEVLSSSSSASHTHITHTHTHWHIHAAARTLHVPRNQIPATALSVQSASGMPLLVFDFAVVDAVSGTELGRPYAVSGTDPGRPYEVATQCPVLTYGTSRAGASNGNGDASREREEGGRQRRAQLDRY